MAATPAPAATDYTPAGELKIGQVGIANLRVLTLDVAQLAAEMRSRVARAPSLFARAAVIVDFGALPALPDVATARSLITALTDASVLPVALAYGSSDNAALAEALGLPLLSKFRAQYESTDQAAPAAPQAPRETAAPAAARTVPASSTEAPPRRSVGERQATSAPTPDRAPSPGLIQSTPVRSGQQIHAENRDLTVLSTVGAGAEVIADGSVHIYGALRGRALAGAQGDDKARIFCREFHAELVAIAGHYKVLDDIPKQLHGKAVQVWLDNDTLNIAALG